MLKTRNRQYLEFLYSFLYSIFLGFTTRLYIQWSQPIFEMSIVTQDHVFLSALQPKTAVSTYAVPSEIQLGGNGVTLSDEMTRGKRVQQQVAMRLAEKSSTLPRQNGSTAHYSSSGRTELIYYGDMVLKCTAGYY